MEIPILKQLRFIVNVLAVLFFMILLSCKIIAQNNISTYRENKSSITTNLKQKLVDKITNKGFGGIALKFTSYQDHIAFMSGGRGACIINNRFTFGGAGYGIANSIPLKSPGPDTSRYLKMGYGGVEFGYIFFSKKTYYFGSSLLAAGGATFWQSKPKSEREAIFGNDLRIFAVVEPTLYGVMRVTRSIGLNMGVSYRYAKGAESSYVNDRDLSGLSAYIGLLFGKNVMN